MSAEMILIIIGAAIMVFNIVRYIIFAQSMNDTVTAKNKTVAIWLTIGLVLLIFFLIGYIVVGVFLDPALITAFILFFGSIFVAVILTISSKLNRIAKEGSFKITKLLIERGAELNTISKEGQSNLVLAVGADRTKICEILAQNGADPDIKDQMGMSAYGYATLFKKTEIVEILKPFHKDV